MFKSIIFLLFLVLTFQVGCSKKEQVETHPHESEHAEENVIVLSKKKQEVMHLETVPVQNKKLYQPIFVTGKAIQDPQQTEFIFTSQTGEVQKIISPMGSYVEKGSPLLQVNGQVIRATKSGTVISINALPGQRVTRMIPIATIAHINPIRVIFDVFPQEMDRVRIGQKVEVNLIGHEEEIFPGRVVYLSPNLDETSQSLKVGVDVENLGGHIKYGMFVHGRILEKIAESAILIPDSALVRFDQHFAVFVKISPEEFEKRPVTLGVKNREEVEIKSGLKEGEQIVTKGSFQLKSLSLKHLLEDEH